MSYNRKALSKAKLDLDKYKKPNPYKKDILYTQEGQWKYPGQKTRIPSSDITMQGVPFPVFAQPNVGQPQMMYPGQEYSFPGASYVDEYPQMKKGGLVQMPKPSKKGLASKKYSRSLFATNKLFTENPLFKKPKSKKRKVFDPNAKYYQDGGITLPNDYIKFKTFTETLPSNLQDPNFEYGNPDQYNLYGMWETVGKPNSFAEVQDSEYFPLQDDGTYHGFTVGSDGEFLKPMSHGTTWKEVMNAHLNTDPYFQQNRIIKNEKGRLQYIPNNEDDYIELDLSPEEIEQYAKGGYVVEELPEMQPGGSFKPGTGYKMPTLSKSEMAAVKKEVSKAKPVAAKLTGTVGKSTSSSKAPVKKTFGVTPSGKKVITTVSTKTDEIANKAKEDAAYEKFLDQNLGKEGSNTYTYVDPITGKTEQREYSNAHLKDKGNIAVDEATWNANRDRQNMQHLSEALSGVGEITGINSAIRTGERLIDDPLKFADDLTTGISQAPETLVEGAMTLGSKLFGDNKDYVDVDTDALGVALDVAGALPVFGVAGKAAKPVLKTGLKYADDVIYPTRVYRASVANKNLKNLDYGLSGDAEKIAYEKQLVDKINKKGDFYTKDLEELSQYLSGNESRKGVFMGDDMIIDEVKVPFWKKNILSDKDVVALKQSQGAVLPGQPRTLFQSEINSNEFIIPNKSIFYPRKSTLIKGMPQEISTRPVYIKNYKGDVIDISDDFSPSTPFTHDDAAYSNQAYKYLEDQINAATGQNIPLYNPNPLQEHTLLKNYVKSQKLQNRKEGGYINKMSKEGLKNNYIDINVTEDDIIKYVDGGYIVEELPTYPDGGQNDPPNKKAVIYVDDENDPRYKDYLIRQALYNYSNNPNFNQRLRAGDHIQDAIKNSDQIDLWNKIDDNFYKSQIAEFEKEQGDDKENDYYKKYYNPDLGPWESQVTYKNIPNDQYINDNYSWDDEFLNKYKPLHWTEQTEYTPYPLRDYYTHTGAPYKSNKRWTEPNTVEIEDNVDRETLKKIYPNITDEYIDDYIQKTRTKPDFKTNKYIDGYGYMNIGYDDEYENYIGDPTKKVFVDKDKLKGYLPESVVDHIRQYKEYLPVWGEPEEIYKIKRKEPIVDMLELKRPELIKQDLGLPTVDAVYEDEIQPPTYTPTGSNYIINDYRISPSARKMQRKTNYDSDYYYDHYDDDGNLVLGETTKADQENRRINFKGVSTKKDLKAQKEYNKSYDEYEKLMEQKKLEKKFAESQMGIPKYLNQNNNNSALSSFQKGGQKCPEGQVWDPETKSCRTTVKGYFDMLADAYKGSSLEKGVKTATKKVKDLGSEIAKTPVGQEAIKNYNVKKKEQDDLINYYNETKKSDPSLSLIKDPNTGELQIASTRTAPSQFTMGPQSAGNADWFWQAATLGPGILKGVYEGAPTILSSLNTPIKNIPQLTANNLLMTYFGGHSAANLVDPESTSRQSLSKAYENPTAENILDAAGNTLTDALGVVFSPGVGGAMTAGANYLTTGSLKNAYKINPFAGKLGEYNRVVGPNAMQDLQESGLVRAGDYGGSSMPGQPAWLGKRTTPYPSFGKGIPTSDNVYAQRIIEEGKTPYVISTNRPMKASTLGRHGRGSTQFPVDESGKYMTEFPASEVKVFEFGNPHWLKGYKEVPKELPGSPNASISDKLKQFFDRPPGPMMLLGPSSGSNMIKKNMDYYKQLLDSYDARRMSSANRKFYNDIINTGKKQNGMVTEAQLRELDRLKTGDFNFGKKGYANGGSTTNNYIETYIPEEDLKRLIDQGYIIEEL